MIIKYMRKFALCWMDDEIARRVIVQIPLVMIYLNLDAAQEMGF